MLSSLLSPLIGNNVRVELDNIFLSFSRFCTQSTQQQQQQYQQQIAYIVETKMFLLLLLQFWFNVLHFITIHHKLLNNVQCNQFENVVSFFVLNYMQNKCECEC